MRKSNKFGIVLLLAVPLSAASPAAERVSVSLSKVEGGPAVLEGRFTSAASPATIWATLSDYDRIHLFVSSIRSSRIIRRAKGDFVVEQTMSGKVAFFRKAVYVLLEVAERPPHKISFRDVSNRSFKSYAGTWEIRPDPSGAGTEVVYRLTASPRFFAPDFIANGAFKRTVRSLLEETRDEIERRS